MGRSWTREEVEQVFQARWQGNFNDLLGFEVLEAEEGLRPRGDARGAEAASAFRDRSRRRAGLTRRHRRRRRQLRELPGRHRGW